MHKELLINVHNIHFSQKPFAQLSAQELYDILQLRSAVFVIEQQCIYQDMDGKDAYGLHLTGYLEDGTLAAYARLLPAGISYTEASIGRVVTHSAHRKSGFGKLLMQTAIQEILQLWPDKGIRISAQLYLLEFYRSLGFKETGESYLEDDIPHIEMYYVSA